jgi:excisionase family DNA binding protein
MRLWRAAGCEHYLVRLFLFLHIFQLLCYAWRIQESQMPRAHHPAVNTATAAKYVPMFADTLNPLAVDVGKALAREVVESNRHNSKAVKKAVGVEAKALPASAEALGARFTILVATVLEQSLSSRTAQGRALRMALIAKLANEEIGGTEVPTPGLQAAASDTLLTTAQAAVQLNASRPHVSMLCNAGKLGEVAMTEGGHRRIRSSAVQAYLATRAKQHKGAVSPRRSGVEAGLYAYPDGHFANVVREAGAANPPGNAAPVKSARKSRS